MAEATMRDRAVALARQGFRVFKLDVFSKIPAVENWPELASNDPETVARAWTCPASGDPLDNNIGIATGGDLLVLDVDCSAGKDGLASLSHLVDFTGLSVNTYTISTPSGGRHLYWRSDSQVRNSASAIAPGLDIRGHHGFVVAPGSETVAGTYAVADASPIADAPKWFIDMCGRSRAAPAAPKTLVDPDSQAALDRAAHWLATDAPQAIEGAGGDFTTYKVAARVKDLGVSEPMALELLLTHWNDAKAFPPWSPEALERKIANAYAYGQNALGSASPEAEFDAVEIAEPAAAASEFPPLRFRFVGKTKPTVAKPHLVKGWLGAGTVVSVYGPTNVGKTAVIMDMAWHIGAGKDWNGCPVKHGLVVHIANEGENGLDDRLEVLSQRYGPSELASVACPFDLAPSGKRYREWVLGQIHALEAARGLPCVLLVVDTLAGAAAELDENESREMMTLARIARKIAGDTGATVMLVQHTGHTERRARGSSAIPAAMDTVLEVADGRLSPIKQRDMRKGEPIAFRLLETDVGEDESGETHSSVYVRWLSAGEAQEPAIRLFLKVLAAANNCSENGRTKTKELKEAINDSQKAVRKEPFSQATFYRLCLKVSQTGLADKDEHGQWFIT